MAPGSGNGPRIPCPYEQNSTRLAFRRLPLVELTLDLRDHFLDTSTVQFGKIGLQTTVGIDSPPDQRKAILLLNQLHLGQFCFHAGRIKGKAQSLRGSGRLIVLE